MLTERIASGPGKPCHRVLVVSIFPRCPHVDPPAPHPPRVFVWWSLCTTRMLRHLTRRTSSYWKEEESRGRLRHSSRIKHYECHGQTFHLGFRVWQKRVWQKRVYLQYFLPTTKVQYVYCNHTKFNMGDLTLLTVTANLKKVHAYRWIFAADVELQHVQTCLTSPWARCLTCSILCYCWCNIEDGFLTDINWEVCVNSVPLKNTAAGMKRPGSIVCHTMILAWPLPIGQTLYRCYPHYSCTCIEKKQCSRLALQ